jgi:hypothetical protein
LFYTRDPEYFIQAAYGCQVSGHAERVLLLNGGFVNLSVINADAHDDKPYLRQLLQVVVGLEIVGHCLHTEYNLKREF